MFLRLAISETVAKPTRALEAPFKRLAECKHYSVTVRQGHSLVTENCYERKVEGGHPAPKPQLDISSDFFVSKITLQF